MPATRVKKSTAAQPLAAEKPVKEKKSKTTKNVSHPPYFEMIKEALLALKEKGRSSPYAIVKYMEDKHKVVLPTNFTKTLGLQLKNSAAKGKLIKIKASYKLSGSTVNKANGVKKAAPRKSVKKATTVKPKQVKGIKTHVGAKKEKKVVAA